MKRFLHASPACTMDAVFSVRFLHTETALVFIESSHPGNR